MCLRRLSGLISVQTSLTYARHSAFVPSLTDFQPLGMALSFGQSEYCSSSLTSTRCRVLSSSSSDAIRLFSSVRYRGAILIRGWQVVNNKADSSRLRVIFQSLTWGALLALSS